MTEDNAESGHQPKAAGVEVIQTMTSLSCSPKLLNTDIGAILKFVTELIDAPVFGKAADEAKAAKLTLVKAA